MSVVDGPVHIIVNPTKFSNDITKVQAKVARQVEKLGAAPPTWLETTKDDPGFGQTRQALADGTSMICVLGGDGTVRAVAQELALAASDVPLALLPAGTGNLLARNTGVPFGKLKDGLKVAYTGTDRRIDLGWLRVDDGEKQAFLVMAGLGYDAEIMDASETMKERVGWLAYFLSGAKHLLEDPFTVSVSVNDEKIDLGGDETHARMVLVGNCGSLQAGIQLAPDAEIDDGILDVVLLTPAHLASWATLAHELIGHHETPDSHVLHRSRGQRVDIRVRPAQHVEVDGDVLGHGSHLAVEVQPLAITVRVPA